MKLSTRSRYGLRALVDIAACGEGSVLLKDVASRLHVSQKYLEQLMTPLRAVGFLRGARGAHGGYTLAKPPEAIRLDQVVEALEGKQTLVGCMHDDCTCPMDPTCATHEIWVEIHETVMSILRRKTLADILQRQREIERLRAEGIMYYI